MLRTAGPSLLLGFVFGLAACTSPPGLWAEIQYATRCEETTHCTGPQQHDVCGYTGQPCEAGAPRSTLSCTATESGATRTVSFSASQGSGTSFFSLQVTGLQVASAGGPALGGVCRVTVVEGSNTYEGPCSGAPPVLGQPCQIDNVAFTNDGSGPSVSGDIFCKFLESRASPALQIEVTARGTGPDAAARPGTFQLVSCSGLR